jgi:hypothetical protein
MKLNGWRIGGRRGDVCLAQDFEHDRAASRALAFDGFTAIFHRFFNASRNFFLGLAFDAVSFSHKFFSSKLHARTFLKGYRQARLASNPKGNQLITNGIRQIFTALPAPK